MSRGLIGAAVLACLLSSARVLHGQTPAPPDTVLDRRVRDVASILRCPVCLNLSIQDSPSELAQDMRGVVRDRLAHGENEQQVIDYFVQRYGEWVLMKPPAHGVSLVVWLLPGVVVIGGAALIVFGMKRWVRTTPVVTAEAVPEEDLIKVRQELARQQERGRLD